MTASQEQKLVGALGFLAVWTGLVVLATCGVYSCTHECPTVPQVAASTIDVRTVDKPYPVYVPKIQYKYLKADVSFAKGTKADSTFNFQDSTSPRGFEKLKIENECPDFIAEVDTTIDSNDLHLWYYSAEQRFAVDIRRNTPLVVNIPTTTIATKETTHEKREWWIDALTHLGAAAVGFGIGSVR